MKTKKWSMQRWRPVLLLAVLIGCAGGGSFWVTVEFPAGYQDEASTLEVYAIAPTGGASCGALEEGAALPGDPDYRVEDTVSMSLPVQAGARELRGIGPGSRFFYAQAKDAQDLVILSGCTAAQATGGSGVQDVLVKLDWTCRVSNGGVEICDGIDNNCDGSTDEGDPVLLCTDVPNAVATSCDAGQCTYECDTDWINANDDYSDGCECQVTRNGEEWCDGLDNDCDGEIDGAGCRQCQNDAECEDGLFCTENETCSAGTCSVGGTTDCTDTDPCTADACDETNDVCQHTLVPNPGAEGPWDDPSCSDGLDNDCDLDVDGADPDCRQCASDADCDDQNPCTQNTCTAQRCEVSDQPDGTACDDGLYCTEPDGCSGGVCTGPGRDCSSLDTDCTLGDCNPVLEQCEPQSINEGGGCDDGLYCNRGETCSSGSCTGGNSRDCSSSDDQCNDGACNDNSDACEPQPKTNGTTCDDQDACSSQDTCQGGTCTAGQTDLDADSDNFFDDQCPNGDDCDDGDGNVNPGETEGPDGDPTCSDSKDNDCDGLTDSGDGDCVTVPVTQIYRSVGPGNNSALAWGSGNPVSISGSTATFSSPLPPEIGVGDAILYDTTGDDSVDAIAFIHQRISSSEYTIKDADGDPPAAVGMDDDWTIFRAYTSLYNAERGSENFGIDGTLRDFDTWSSGKDLVASSQVWNIACYGDDSDTSAVRISGWTTGPDNYIRIFTPTSTAEVGTTQRHEGAWEFSKYYLFLTDEPLLDIEEGHTKIEGLQVAADTSGLSSSTEIVEVDAPNVEVSYCIVAQADGTVTTDGISTTVDATDARIWNTVVTYIDNDCIKGDGSAYIYNVTVADCGDDGIQPNDDGVYAVKNALCESAVEDCFDVNDLASMTLDYCASSDGTADDFGGSGNRVYQTFSFVDRWNGDFHLTPGDSGASDHGTDLSSDPDLAFSDDIDGDTRGGAWDIGADEYQ